MLGPGEFVETEDDTGVAEFLADQVPARIGDVGVFDAEDEADFAFEVGEEVDGVRGLGEGGRGFGGGVGT